MEIHINIDSPGLRLETIVDGEALPSLLELVQRHRIDTPTSGVMNRPRPMGSRGRNHRGRPGMPELVVELDATAQDVRERVSALTLEDLFLKKAMPETFPEKFLVIAAWHEARARRNNTEEKLGGRVFVRSLVELGETPPANPPRDVQQTIAQGWLARSPKTRLTVTNAGWHHLGEMLRDGDTQVPA